MVVSAWILILLVISILSVIAVLFLPNNFWKIDEAEDKTVTDLIKKVRKIEVKAKRLSNQIFSGEYHSAFKGRGMSFSEVREYQFGDDVRNIDWNVTARFNSPFVKVFEEERELTVMLLIDVSQSSFFGTKGKMKNELITEICAVLSISAINNNDKVGAILFTDRIEKFIPPKKGKSHILRIINELFDFKPVGQATDIGQALQYLGNVMKRKSIAFILSDFMDEDYEKALDYVSRKHDLTAIHIHDPAEENMERWGVVSSVDPETGERAWVDFSSNSYAKQHDIAFQTQIGKTKEAFVKSGAGWINVRTDRPYIKVLMDYFKKRA